MKDVSASWVARRAGLSVSFVSRLMRGERRPSLRSLTKLSKALGISMGSTVKWLGWVDGERKE